MTRHKGKTAPKTGGSNGKKPPLTHFLCVPLVTASSRPQLEVSLARFRDQVAGIKSATSVSALEDYQPGTQGAGATPAVPEKAIRPVGTLHLTLGVMSLDEERLTCAIELLHSIDTAELLKEVGLKASPALLSITLESLHSMHSPSKTSILYAIPTDPTNRLHAFASRIRSLFTDADLVVLDDRPLKLHATIVNTIYAKKEGRKRPGRIADSSSNSATSKGSNDRAEGHGPHSRAPIRLDARELMDRYKDFVWAQDVAVEKVAVCKMGARKVVDEWGRVVDEVYEEVGSVAVVGR
ncbi:kinase A anchor protein [Cryomyces antarcticus]